MTSHTKPTLYRPPNAHILIVGAGFAGLASAWSMIQLGYQVTLIEIAPALKKGGTPVDIKQESIGILRTMGLLDKVRSLSLPPRQLEIMTGNDKAEFVIPPKPFLPDGPGEQYEIERDTLLDLMLRAIPPDVTIQFKQSVRALEENEHGITAHFNDGTSGNYSMVLGCDGMRSSIRRLIFGPDETCVIFLKKYGFLKIIPEQLVPPDVTRIYTVKGKSVMLNGYKNKTDIAFGLHADAPLSYNRHDKSRQLQLIHENFQNLGWKTPDLLPLINSDDDFYFDQICQIRLPAWSKGRVALVGDSGYCPSPLAGMGGSMAIIGAAALHESFHRHGQDITSAFQTYEETLRPFVEDVQTRARNFGKIMFAPENDDALAARRQKLEEITG